MRVGGRIFTEGEREREKENAAFRKEERENSNKSNRRKGKKNEKRREAHTAR